MSIKFEIRQQVKSVKGNRMEVVYENPGEHSARASFRELSADYPGEYFELVRVETKEECLDYSLKP